MFDIKNPKLRLIRVILICGLTVFPLFSAYAQGDGQEGRYENLLDALKGGKTSAQLRLSYETSDLKGDTTGHPAQAVNMRTRLGYRTGKFDGLLPDLLDISGFIQFHNVSALLDHYAPENGKYDVVGDPEGSRIQQTYVDLGFFDTRVRFGRQEIIMDDHRLIGNVDWRQNGQSFDGVTVINKSVSDFQLSGSYLARVNTINLTRLDLNDLILTHAKYTGIKSAVISVYNYLLDSTGSQTNARDLGTVGGRVAGKVPLIEELKLDYAFDYSKQYDYRDGDNYDGNMINGFVGFICSGIELGGGYSRISAQKGSSGKISRKAFDTLFSTAHKFNGWSDQFLATNGGGLVNGLEDIYVQLKAIYKPGKSVFLARYHFFDTVNNLTYTKGGNTYAGGNSYGNELDLQLVTKLHTNICLLVKYANYFADTNNADRFGRQDEQVFWTRLTYNL